MKWIQRLLVFGGVVGMAVGAQASPASGTFTMLDGSGGSVPTGTGGPDPFVTGSIGGGSWSVSSPTKFFGQNWTAHGGTTFGPGTYTFATGNGSYTNVVVNAGQVGGHILFDWGINANIDVIQIWNVVGNTYTSVDANAGIGSTAPGPTSGWYGASAEPDGFNGVQMIDGAFPGYQANFDLTAVPEPMSMALVGSSIIGLVALGRRRRA
jgi:hypothetical protein